MMSRKQCLKIFVFKVPMDINVLVFMHFYAMVMFQFAKWLEFFPLSSNDIIFEQLITDFLVMTNDSS